MKILSINFEHDSSVCLFNNGKLEKYFLTERYTKVKHDDRVFFILEFILKIIETEVDYVIFSSFEYNVEKYREGIVKNFLHLYKKFYQNNVNILFDKEHHKSHANIAYYRSRFKESIVVVVDGNGNDIEGNGLVEVESIYYYNDLERKLLYKNTIESVNSITLPWDKKFVKIQSKYQHNNIFGVGILYDIASVLIGNTPNDCGKAMGLSSYGNDDGDFKNIFLDGNNLNKLFYEESSDQIKKFLKTPIKNLSKDNYKKYSNFCYEVQKQTQQVVGDLIEKSIKETGIKNVCISGGYGMNIVANYYYLQRFPDVKFYFEPICNDNGISIGSAIGLINHLIPSEKIDLPKTTSFHGVVYDVSSYIGKTTSIQEIAKIIHDNKSVAVYTGLAEAGQRALGNRSILFNAMNPSAKDIVNSIKKREWYRPFAAMVLEEDVSTYFEVDKQIYSPFMTICFPVKLEYAKIIQGVTHIDNTCRIQTVSKNDGYLYKLLQEFKKLSGHGILLNTSFNLAGEPLVETPEDAFKTLNNSCLDYLWFEETKQLFEKKMIYV
jgi:carbamoyltransferase